MSIPNITTLECMFRNTEGGSNTVLVNGCFDLLHPGHIYLLGRAREIADRITGKVLVAVNNDSSAWTLKNRQPIMNQYERLAILDALRAVDYTISYETEEQLCRIIEVVRPYFMVKGNDYMNLPITGQDIMATYGGNIIFMDRDEIPVSTTDIIERVLDRNKRITGL